MFSEKIKTIGIIGKGTVGTAVGEGLKSFGYEILYHDKYKESYPLKTVAERSDIIFVCVPTPCKANGEIDLSIIDEVVEDISKYAENEQKIIIKSTVIPTTTEHYQEKYPHLVFFMCPEFLDEDTAKYDFLHPFVIIIGYTTKSEEYVEDLIPVFKKFRAPIHTMHATEAEMVKYMTNSFFVLKVVFANQIYDLCTMLGIDYYRVKDSFVSNPRVGDSHFIVEHKGGRGAGGKCLPKDLSAFIQFAKRKNCPLTLLETAEKINSKLLKQTGKC